MKVLIDNGHGKNTPGKRSPDGRLREWSYTREIADRVVYELKKRGIDAERIVKEDVEYLFRAILYYDHSSFSDIHIQLWHHHRLLVTRPVRFAA